MGPILIWAGFRFRKRRAVPVCVLIAGAGIIAFMITRETRSQQEEQFLDKVYYYHNDHLGAPLKMTDQDTNIVWFTDYAPFGYAFGTGEVEVTNKFRFPGQYDDGYLYYNMNRYYNPDIGRYNQVDPLQDTTKTDYIYGYNNPINYYDMLGLAAKKCCWEIEHFTSNEDYQNTIDYWESKNPNVRSPDYECGLYYGYKYSKMVGKWDDKYKHCWVGCMVANSCREAAVDVAGWTKEWMDLTDCNGKTHFEVADYDATLKGKHQGKVDCDVFCKQAGFKP